MIKKSITLLPGQTYHFPEDNSQTQTYVGITIIAPLINTAVIAFDSDPTTFPVETIQCVHCTFSYFTIFNTNTLSAISLTIYIQTDPTEFLPCPHEVISQVSPNLSPAEFYSDYNVQLGTSSSTTTFTQLNLGQIYLEMDIMIMNNPAVVQFLLSNNTYGPSLTLQPGYYAFALQGYGIQFMAANSGTTTSVQLIGLQ